MSGATISCGSGGAALDTQTVTTGGDGALATLDRRRGFIVSTFGSIVTGTSQIYGAAFQNLNWSENGAGGADFVSMKLAGLQANSGWATMTVGGTTFLRSAATFLQSGGNTSWTWNNQGFAIGTQPFGGIGSTPIATFN